jgi:hypothetical protein
MKDVENSGVNNSAAATAIPPVAAGTEQGAAPATAPILGEGGSKGGKAGKGGAAGAAVADAPASPPLGGAAAKNGGSVAGGAVGPVAAKPASEKLDAGDVDGEGAQRQVYFPKSDLNPVVEALQKSGGYLADLGKGNHSVICPKLGDHGDEQGVRTIYVAPNAVFPAGNLLCQGDHEQGIFIHDLLAHLGISYAEARHRSCIRYVQGELSAVLNAMETELAMLGRFFHMQGTMVSIGFDANGNTLVTPVNEQMLTQVFASCIDFEKYDGRVKGYAPCDPQSKYVNMLLNKRDFEILPQLNGVARQPYFMRKHSGETVLCVKDGYSASSGLLGAFRGQDYVLPAPTLENAKAALAILLDLIAEFHFVSDLDRAVALSAMFTGVFRASIALAPGFHARAPVIASGKSLLCQLIGLFAGPESNKKISYPKSSEEATKVILSALLSSPAVIEFDDMTHDWVAHGVVNRLFTSEWITDRILGASKMATVSTRTLVLGSGNNVGPIRDLCRRVATCNLDPRCDSPASLSYRKDPVGMVRKNRAKYVGAVLTVVQAWLAAGSPIADVSNIASFGGDWSDYCRHPLIWLGQADPAEAFFEQLKSDPDVEMLGRLLKQWHKAFGSTAKPLRAVVGALSNHLDLHDAIAEFPVMERGEVHRPKFGWLLKRNANRIVDGLMFERVDGTERTAWRVVEVVGKATTAPASPALPALASPVPKEPAFGNLTEFAEQQQSEADSIDGPSTSTTSTAGTDGQAIPF